MIRNHEQLELGQEFIKCKKRMANYLQKNGAALFSFDENLKMFVFRKTSLIKELIRDAPLSLKIIDKLGI